jgi:GNAT superfamily N-acetyltransferase
VNARGDRRALLARIDAYCDTVPRVAARVEEHGPFTLFVRTGAWAYYARPRIAPPPPAAGFTREAVEQVRARQRALGVPEALEWLHDVAPGLAAAAEATGLRVRRHPLLALSAPPAPLARAPEVTVRLLTPEDPALALAQAAVELGFAAGGTARGSLGARERDVEAARADPGRLAFVRRLLGAGHIVMAVAEGAEGVLGGGTASPRGTVAELAGIATLPAARRRGAARAVTDALVGAVTGRGVDTVFLSAADDAVARIYAGAGFRRVGTACIAEPE